MKEKKNNEKPNTKKVLNKKLLVAGISFTLFVVLTILVLLKVTNKIDLAIESYMISIRNETLTNFMIIITNIGGSYSLISLTFLAMLIAIIKQKRLPLNTMINLVIVFLTSQLFKYIIHRPRPTGVFLTHATGYSYPSGHTMVSFAFFVFIACSLCEKVNNKTLKLLIKILTAILVITISFSRIYLGVHYLTDIIGSYLLGTTYLMIFLNIRATYIKKRIKWK